MCQCIILHSHSLIYNLVSLNHLVSTETVQNSSYESAQHFWSTCWSICTAMYVNSKAVPQFVHFFGSRERIFTELVFLQDNNHSNLCLKLNPLLSLCLRYLFLRRRTRGAVEGHKLLDDEIPASSHTSLQQLYRSGRQRWHDLAQQDPGQRNCPLFKPLNRFILASFHRCWTAIHRQIRKTDAVAIGIN